MNHLNKIKLFALAFFMPAIAFCQDEAAKETTSYFSNALFLTMLSLIIILAIVIVTFSSVFKNLAQSDYLINKYNSKKDSDK
ncbi:MAG: hypothetical protein ACK504_09635, partial [Bacteroidota bacterium]